MEKKKKSLRLIHIILIGCVFVIGIIAGVIFSNTMNKDNTSGNEVIQNEIVKTNTNVKEVNKEYFSKEIELPKESKVVKNENCKNELILKKSKIDNEKLILKFELNTKNNPIKNIDNINIVNNARLEIGNEIYVLNKAYLNAFEMIEVDTDLYELYVLYDIEGLKYDKNIKFTANIIIDEAEEYYADVDVKFWEIGNWNVEFAIDEKMKTNCNEKYRIDNLIIETDEDKKFDEENWKIFNVSILEENVLINGLLSSYTTEPGILYSIEIFDDKNNSLMLNGKKVVIGGIRQDILLEKFDLFSDIKIKFEVFVYGENEVLGQGEKILKISDYIRNDENANKQIEKAYNEELSFEYDSEKWEIRSDNIYDVIVLDDLEYPINIDLKSLNEYSRDISITKYENIFSESLEEIFENRQKLLELGLHGIRQETYPIGVDVGPYDEYGNPADVKFYDFTDAEVMDIYNGKTVTKEDMEFDKETFKEHANYDPNYWWKYKNFGNIVIDGNEAITFITETADQSDRSYIVIVNDCIYEIIVPSDLRLEDDYYEIVNSIKFK